jgi:hypothetical protein
MTTSSLSGLYLLRIPAPSFSLFYRLQQIPCLAESYLIDRSAELEDNQKTTKETLYDFHPFADQLYPGKTVCSKSSLYQQQNSLESSTILRPLPL